MKGYLLELLDVVEAHVPGTLTTTNMWYYSPLRHFDYAPIAYTGRMSRAGNGFYPGNSIPDNDGLRGALFGIARIQYESANPFWCTAFITMTATPGSIRKSAYASLMLGNQLVCGWTWQTMHAGEEQFLQGMADWDGEPNRKIKEYRRIAEEFAKIGLHGFPYRPRAEIAVALDFPSQIASAAFPEPHDAQAQTAFAAVLDRNLDARLVDLSRSDLDYKILIVPGVLVLDEAAAAKIRGFVEVGGTAIMTSYSAALDANGKSSTRPGPAAWPTCSASGSGPMKSRSSSTSSRAGAPATTASTSWSAATASPPPRRGSTASSPAPPTCSAPRPGSAATTRSLP